MGYMRHHAIVVTSWDQKLLAEAHAKAVELGACVSPLVNGHINMYQSFLVAPDGSKEGWDTSDEGDAQRAALVEWLDAQRYDDDSTCLSWVEVQFGDEELHTCIVADSDERRRRAEDPRVRAFEELRRLSEEIGWTNDRPEICEKHERHEPCRPCLAEEGFYDSPEWKDRHGL
ncbi:hypothetical protein [Acinetobacter baumannii]|uniref:Uncharacterized protein n=1 Tax=Acinetobacter baumannii TaxID=470 RepID=A0AAJ0VMI9_ACIBA|nr:hypothetical protein [Acinetobacter baumannii]ATN88863.1 hypothetical protein SEA_DMPSTRDIVER_54 [Mycobacterium phage DmpstrDiver]KZA08334.1 hypothetical protein LV35_04184 [Acinetobacter baumannii]